MLKFEKLNQFRQSIYKSFPKRGDATMNLLDALSSDGHNCRSVVELSEASCFKRQYSSVTDAIADGLPSISWDNLSKSVYQAIEESGDRILLVTDSTPNPRPKARRLKDRHITHCPNPAPGNKPICEGHSYSVVSMLPQNGLAQEKHWCLPLSVERIQSHQKGNEKGMDQLNKLLSTLSLDDKLVIHVADSLYGTEPCRQSAMASSNLAHIFRVNSTRNIYQIAEKTDKRSGRHKSYGTKMKLNDTKTHIVPDDEQSFSIQTPRGYQRTVTIKYWRELVFRGSRKFKGHTHPISVLQISVTDDNGKPVYKAPLWLGVSGDRRDEITLRQAYEYYARRYDIEHFFRFGKNKLLFDAYQTADIVHEENWWHFAPLAYVQLYLASNKAELRPKRWEKYLPSYRIDQKKDYLATPSQSQRAFASVLSIIGSPARECRARGNPLGRAHGDKQIPREKYDTIFKGKQISRKKNLIHDPDKLAKNSDSQKIEDFASRVKENLQSMGCSPKKFSQLLLNSV